MAVKTTRISWLSSAFVALLLSGNMAVQFPEVLGEVPLSAPPTSLSSTTSEVTVAIGSCRWESRHPSTAFLGLAKCKRQPVQDRKLTTTRSLGTKPVFSFGHARATTDSHEVDHDLSSGTVSGRRHFLGSLATTAIVSPLASTRDTALAAETNATGTVDWDSFGAQLQKSGPVTFPANGAKSGSDLDQALKDSSQRKTIDPRTHG